MFTHSPNCFIVFAKCTTRHERLAVELESREISPLDTCSPHQGQESHFLKMGGREAELKEI